MAEPCIFGILTTILHTPNEKQMPQYCDRFYMMAFYQFENRGLGGLARRGVSGVPDRFDCS